jgi:hypothetical protein
MATSEAESIPNLIQAGGQRISLDLSGATNRRVERGWE